MDSADQLKQELQAAIDERLGSTANKDFTVLIVDDEVSLRSLFGKVLEKAGYTIATAADGQDALKLAAELNPQLVVTDIRMPIMSGVEFIEKLRADGQSLPCIFMTGYTDYDTISKAIKLQPFGFLEKPFQPDQLLRLTERAFREHVSSLREDLYTDVLMETVEEKTRELSFRTERLMAEKTLLHGVIGSATFGLIAVDRNETVHLLNEYAANLVLSPDQSSDQSLGERLSFALAPSFQADFRQLFDDCLASTKKATRQIVDEASGRSLDIVVYPVKYRDDVAAIVYVLHDVTELESLQRRLIQSSKLASIGELAAGVAHEINNPLGFVTSNCNTLSDYLESFIQFVVKIGESANGSGSVSWTSSDLAEIRKQLDLDYAVEDGRQLISETLDGLDRVSKIVADLKTFARVDSHTPEAFDLGEVIDNALNICRNETKHKLEITRDYGEGIRIEGYPSQLAQVFTNIIVNAAQAVEKDGHMKVTISPKDETVVVQFSDDGPGIPPATLNKIFDPFFTTKEPGKGTGMGLSISYGIVEKHGGTITAESVVGSGTTFTIQLPRAHAPETEVSALEGETAK